ncbi:MAG: hypothetical protein ABIT37_17500 [Luteolibacter sp.]
MPSEPPLSTLQSGVLTSPADALLAKAISSTLQAAAHLRAALFERLALEIHSFMAENPHERPWTCTLFTGTDGSRVFRGGIGHSIVIDPSGRLWRARSYEDFDTTYNLTANSCEIATLTPLYAQMREYSQRESASFSDPQDG